MSNEASFYRSSSAFKVFMTFAMLLISPETVSKILKRSIHDG